MLEFLPAALSLAESLFGSHGGMPQESPASQMAMQNMQQSNQLLQGSMDPANAILRALSTNQQQRGMYDLGTSLHMLMNKQRRAQAEGRPVQFFDPERADENMASMFSKQAVEGGYKANTDAANTMRAIASALSGQASGFSELGQQQTAMAGQQAGWQNSLFQGLGKLIQTPFNSGGSSILSSLQGLSF